MDQVVREIEEAILDAYSSAQKNNDRATLDQWADIPCEGHLPTALELITYLGNKVHNQRLSCGKRSFPDSGIPKTGPEAGPV